MIHVTYDGAYSLTMEGHAGQALIGHDIVCAGASMLICSLAKMLERHKKECTFLDISVESGYGHISAQPSIAFAEGCRSAFETALCGYEELAHHYPSFIRLERVRLE